MPYSPPRAVLLYTITHALSLQKCDFLVAILQLIILYLVNDHVVLFEELDIKTLTCDENTPDLEEGDNPLIRVVHGESTYSRSWLIGILWEKREKRLSRVLQLFS